MRENQSFPNRTSGTLCIMYTEVCFVWSVEACLPESCNPHVGVTGLCNSGTEVCFVWRVEGCLPESRTSLLMYWVQAASIVSYAPRYVCVEACLPESCTPYVLETAAPRYDLFGGLWVVHQSPVPPYLCTGYVPDS